MRIMQVEPGEDLTADATMASNDRRSAQRVRTVFRLARLTAPSDQGLARIHNISDSGVRLAVHLPLYRGDALTLELAQNIALAGHVVWREGGDCGVTLDAPLDSAALLADLATLAQADRARPLRLPVATRALVNSTNGAMTVDVTDVSQRGMKLVHDGTCVEGSTLAITLRSGRQRHGIVRWSHGGATGVLLFDPFSVADLGRVSAL